MQAGNPVSEELSTLLSSDRIMSGHKMHHLCEAVNYNQDGGESRPCLREMGDEVHRKTFPLRGRNFERQSLPERKLCAALVPLAFFAAPRKGVHISS